MKLHIYTSTPGLNRYPESERFALYCSVHRRLMHEDTAYRERYNSYITAIIWGGAGLLGVVLSILTPLAFTAVIVWLAFRTQKFMNQRIGEALQGQAVNP